jgi:uncharacterized membrane protein
MARDIQDMAKEALLNAVQSRISGMGQGGESSNGNGSGRNGGGMSGGMKGLVMGAGAAALAPIVLKNIGNISNLGERLGIEGLGDISSPGDAVGKLASNAGSGLGDKLTGKLDEAGGPSGILKDTVKDALPFGGGSGGGGKGGVEGVGKGRRMPIQQSIDIGIPRESVYNQFTQFEDWPTFMHRVTRVTQDDDCTVKFAVKIWGKTKEFTAKIETQRPDKRIKWKVSEGMTHVGVVTFHELGPELTRVLLDFEVQPGSLIEKAARGMRHVKRAARADLHRFKALIENAEHETGAWRGVIEEGELVEEHDPSYDEEREYTDIDDLVEDEDEGDDEEQDEGDDESQDEGDDEEQEEDDRPQRRRQRSRSRASSEGSGASSRSRGASHSRESRSGGRSRGSSNGESRGGAKKSSQGRSGSSSAKKSSGKRSSSASARSKSSGSRASGRSNGSSGRSSSGGSRSSSKSSSSSGRKSSGSRARARKSNG